jgi:hypothetical protein
LANNQVIFLIGGTVDNDAKAGMFYWDAASTATADDDDVVQVTGVTTGRWIRLVDQQYVNITGDTMTGNLSLTGNIVQTGNQDITGDVDVSGTVTVDTDVIVAGGSVWTDANDGADSGLDADLIRGIAGDFTKYHSANGYQKFPNGLILQWGKGTASRTGETVTFPMTFPTATLCVVATHSTNEDLTQSSGYAGKCTAVIIDTSSFTAQAEDSGSDFVHFIAVGY